MGVETKFLININIIVRSTVFNTVDIFIYKNMLFIESRTGAASIAKQNGLIHVGGGYYSDVSGKIVGYSNDGASLNYCSDNDVDNNRKYKNKYYTQKDINMPNPLGSGSDKTEPNITPTKKKKSLVEFFHNSCNVGGMWRINYQIPATGKKIHYIYIDATNQKEAVSKIKAFVKDIRLVGYPRRM